MPFEALSQNIVLLLILSIFSRLIPLHGVPNTRRIPFPEDIPPAVIVHKRFVREAYPLGQPTPKMIYLLIPWVRKIGIALPKALSKENV